MANRRALSLCHSERGEESRILVQTTESFSGFPSTALRAGFAEFTLSNLEGQTAL